MNGAVETFAALRAQPAADAEASQAKILLVDDEPKSLYALQELLCTLGEHLLVAQSGEEALRIGLVNAVFAPGELLAGVKPNERKRSKSISISRSWPRYVKSAPPQTAGTPQAP